MKNSKRCEPRVCEPKVCESKGCNKPNYSQKKWCRACRLRFGRRQIWACSNTCSFTCGACGRCECHDGETECENGMCYGCT